MHAPIKTLLGALIWAITAQAVQVQAQDRGDRYTPTLNPCRTPMPDIPASRNGDGNSGFPPARAAASADKGGPSNNGFAPPARLDIHG